MARVEIVVVDPTEDEHQAMRNGGDPLRALCRKEVDAFEEKLRQHPHYPEGLSRFERFAIEGYVYQKIRGGFDETLDQADPTDRRQDGTPPSS